MIIICKKLHKVITNYLSDVLFIPIPNAIKTLHGINSVEMPLNNDAEMVKFCITVSISYNIITGFLEPKHFDLGDNFFQGSSKFNI